MISLHPSHDLSVKQKKLLLPVADPSNLLKDRREIDGRADTRDPYEMVEHGLSLLYATAQRSGAKSLTMPISDALHVAIVVTDLAAADHFYGQVLGIPKVARDLNFPGSWYEVGGFQLHLMVGEVAPVAYANPKWGRHPHLALRVSDLAAMQDRLEQAGCSVQKSASGRAALFVKDPDGYVIELSAVHPST
ncbi:MAG: VOC family protein [Cyanobacteriota bacterium]|nr:VOC family protein [Cyanobacteriota bacterium]